jgi:uncharacterized protein
MDILVTGARGFLGRAVAQALAKKGHRIFAVVRDDKSSSLPFPCQIIEGDLAQEPLSSEPLHSIQAVIHLAGENIAAGRWTKKRKRKIYDSRVRGTQNLILSLQESTKVRVFISMSAVGFYGDRGDEILTESSWRGEGFLSHVCQDWEQAVYIAERKKSFPECRYVVLRSGVVLGENGGMLKQLLPLFRRGLGLRLGGGQQWLSWIHIEDLIQLILTAVEDQQYSGTINAVAPQPITNQKFTEALAKQFSFRSRFSLPKGILRILFGEMSYLFLASQRVRSEVLEKSSFSFKYADIDTALAQITKANS